MMTPIKFEHLDLPIIRSCNLACVGCMTHSDHKNIKGTVRVEDSHEWLEFWSKRIAPESITLFGGEPLLHPEFANWVVAIKQYWPTSGVNVNTNGYYLDRIYDKIPELFHPDIKLSMIISIQTGLEPYLSHVKNNLEIFKQKVLDYYKIIMPDATVAWELWLDESAINFKQWFRLTVNGHAHGIGFGVCEQHKLHWAMHYTGRGETMRPVYDYNDVWYTNNHKSCQTNNFPNLYQGRMYKCPPMAVLEHSLDTFDIEDQPEWKPYISDYVTVGTESTDEEIVNWFTQQKNPEKVCNMCGHQGPKSKSISGETRSHELKNNWNYTLQTLNS